MNTKPPSVKQLVKIVDKFSNLIEHGIIQRLPQFYNRDLSVEYAKFDKKKKNGDEMKSLTMDQLKRPLMLLFIILGVSTFILIIENLLYLLNKLQDLSQR